GPPSGSSIASDARAKGTGRGRAGLDAAGSANSRASRSGDAVPVGIGDVALRGDTCDTVSWISEFVQSTDPGSPIRLIPLHPELSRGTRRRDEGRLSRNFGLLSTCRGMEAKSSAAFGVCAREVESVTRS